MYLPSHEVIHLLARNLFLGSHFRQKICREHTSLHPVMVHEDVSLTSQLYSVTL